MPSLCSPGRKRSLRCRQKTSETSSAARGVPQRVTVDRTVPVKYAWYHSATARQACSPDGLSFIATDFFHRGLGLTRCLTCCPPDRGSSIGRACCAGRHTALRRAATQAGGRFPSGSFGRFHRAGACGGLTCPDTTPCRPAGFGSSQPLPASAWPGLPAPRDAGRVLALMPVVVGAGGAAELAVFLLVARVVVAERHQCGGADGHCIGAQ